MGRRQLLDFLIGDEGIFLPTPTRQLYLCAGCQSSGSTLVSWCFLQRSDMDGVLDARFDMIPQVPRNLKRPLAWVKFTVACFRFSEVAAYLEDEGWGIRPLLVVRDARAVFNSLITKPYGRNGTTADDPPIRLRLRRFLEDWRMFHDRGWPVVRYEDLIVEPEKTLKDACAALELPWDDAMLNWPKAESDIADASFGNPTFVQSRGVGIRQTLRPSLGAVKTGNIPPADLEWLEREFGEMNQALGYAEHVTGGQSRSEVARAVPRFENTRRYERLRRKNRLGRYLRVARNALTGIITREPRRDAAQSPDPLPGSH